MQRPLVLLLGHDSKALSQERMEDVQKWAQQEQEEEEENCCYACLRPAEQQDRTEGTNIADRNGDRLEDTVLAVIAETIQQYAAEAEQRMVLLLCGYPSSLTELETLVDRGMIDGILTIISDDSGSEVRSSDGPRSTSGADRFVSTSTPDPIEEDRKFIANIPPERLPTVTSWTQLVRDQLKYGDKWLNVSVDEVNAREWDEELGCMTDMPADKFREIFSHRLQELAETRHDYAQRVSRITQYTIGHGEISADRATAAEGTEHDVAQQDEQSPHDHDDQQEDGDVTSSMDRAQSSKPLDVDLLAAYNSLLGKVPSMACTESIVLCAIVAAVTHSDELIPARLSARAGSMLEWNNSWGVHEIPCIIEDDDAISARGTRISVAVATAARAANLTNADSGARMSAINPHNWIEFTKAARSQAQSPRLLGLSAMPVHDDMDEKERGLMETELMAFAKAPSAFIHRCRIVRMFDALIEKLASYESLSARSMFNWTTLNHRFHRQLSASVFQQILAAEMRKLPIVIREYDSVTDRLLVIVMWRPVSGRMSRTKRRLKDFVRPRATYEEFLAHRQGNLTPRTVTSMQSVLNLDDDGEPATLNRVVETVQLFPSDHSIITATGGDLNSSIAINFQNYTVGLRKRTTIADANVNEATAKPNERCCLVCEADDDVVRFVVGISDEGTPYVSCTTADSQLLRFSLDRSVSMSFQTLDPKEQLLCPAAQRELERRITTNGEVVQLLRDGTQRRLKPTGEIVSYLPAQKRQDDEEAAGNRWFDEIHIARASGIDSTWTAEFDQWIHDSAAMMDVRSEKDIPSGATCEIRSNGMSVARFLDGGTVATFPDGTSIRCAPDYAESRLVFVECPGLPAVEMNTNVSPLSPRETRSCFRCVTLDGTKIQNVAKYIGVSRTERTLVLERRDGTKLQVAENGRVTLTFSFRFEVWDGNETLTQETSTTYEFELASGKCWVEDSESNRFELQMTDPLNSRVDLAGSVPGVRAKPLISDPIPPRFFVMQRDGCAVELLDRVQIPIARNNKSGMPAVCSPRESTVNEVESAPSPAAAQMPPFFWAVPTSRHTFQDGWQAYDWETRPLPAAVKVGLNDVLSTLAKNLPPIYLQQVVLQMEPISATDVQRIADAVLEWQRWKNSRVAHGTRVLEDPRRLEERELEAELSKQLRQLYKHIRANARKEKRLGHETMMQKASEEMARQDAALDSESALSDTSSMTGDEPVVDEEEIELLDAFQAATRTESGTHVSFDGLRQALVQVLGRGVSRSELRAAMAEVLAGMTDVAEKQYDMEEFRSIYKFFSNERTHESAADSMGADGSSGDFGTQTAPAGVMQTAGFEGVGNIPGRAITQTGVPRNGWAKHDEIRLPSRPAVGSGRNAVLAGGAQS